MLHCVKNEIAMAHCSHKYSTNIFDDGLFV